MQEVPLPVERRTVPPSNSLGSPSIFREGSATSSAYAWRRGLDGGRRQSGGREGRALVEDTGVFFVDRSDRRLLDGQLAFQRLRLLRLPASRERQARGERARASEAEEPARDHWMSTVRALMLTSLAAELPLRFEAGERRDSIPSRIAFVP